MVYLLDTNILIYFLKGRFGISERIEQIGFENFHISEISVAELKYGAEKSDFPDKNRIIVNTLIERFKIIPIFSSLDIYAKEKAQLRKEGKIVDDLDLFIGATSIEKDLILVTNNEKHFSRLKNIKIENWTL